LVTAQAIFPPAAIPSPFLATDTNHHFNGWLSDVSESKPGIAPA